MGIQNLHKFLRKHVNHIYENRKPLSNYSNKIFAIDINVYLFYYKKSLKSKWMQGFFNFITVFKKYKITPVFVYDTKSPQEKDITKEERRNRKKLVYERIETITKALEKFEKEGVVCELLRNIMAKRGHTMSILLSDDENNMDYVNPMVIHHELESLRNQIVSVTYTDIQESKELLTYLNIPFFDSENEAETFCAYLCYHNLVDAVLSNDTDVLAYKTPVFLTKLVLKKQKNMGEEDTVIEINYNELLKHLEFTSEQFTDLCIMSGTDYNKNIFRIGNEKAFKLLQQYYSIENIEKEKGLDIKILNHERVRHIFTVPELNQCKDEKFIWNEPNWDTLNEFIRFRGMNSDMLKNLWMS